MVKRLAIVGFGKIAEFLLEAFVSSTDQRLRSNFEIVAIWNRSICKLRESKLVDPRWIIENLEELSSRKPDLIVEVSHPDVLVSFGVFFLTISDLFIGSPTAFANDEFFKTITGAAHDPAVRGSVYIPVGALWGCSDIAKMGERSAISSASITMKKPAHSLKLEEPLRSCLMKYNDDPAQFGEYVLYEGPVRQLCALAPNNVNTMACFAIATHLGFENVVGRLVVDKALAAHVIMIEVIGKSIPGRDDVFFAKSERYNPCNPNEVTGIQTYVSFLSSLVRSATSLGNGVHFI
jgi:aspartate dehydrogenase